MERTISATLTLALVLFASTNLDDFFVLVDFSPMCVLGIAKYQLASIWASELLVVVSVAPSLFTSAFAIPYIGLLTIIPISIGVKNLVYVARDGAYKQSGFAVKRSGKSLKQVVAVSGVTIANGGDNLGIYTPAFATQSRMGLAVFALVFAVMTGVWCLFARWIVSHPRLEMPIRRYGHISASLVLITLGVMVIIQASLT